jgi:small subunit ribosomal protein S6
MLDADIDEERVGAVMDRVRSLIGEGGEVVDEDSWGRKKLAYKIGERSEANYHLAHLTMEGDASKNLEAGLKLTEEVVRHLLVRQD